MAASLDTLQTAKRLREAGFAEPQAEALTNLLREAQQAGAAQLATKTDLGALDANIDRITAELHAKIDRVAAELDAKIERVAAELDAKIERVAAELDAKIERVAAELDAKIERVAAELDAKIERVATELRAEFALIRSEMEVLRRDLTIRLGSMIVVATGVLLAAKFFG
jgi:DNA anti-recombination protein RmuC